ncbi:MAG TPA: glycosyltransferase family A protein [Candidatus Melainabacteria bacterium]|nr:glycosyltransferase family A protein [Candidatus Melainabacteria bacterium]
MQKAPLISIVITYYSYADFLLEAVASIKAQTYRNFEVIIVDDGSPEKHVFELDFGPVDFPLKIVTHESNKGLPEARNTGVKQASGDFLVIMDSDDLILPTFLEETMAALMNSDNDGIYTQMQLFGARDYLWKDEVSLFSLLAGEPGPVTFLMKRRVFEEVGGYNQHLTLNSDHEFWVAALGAGLKFGRIERPLFKYRKHEFSMSSVNRDQWWQSIPVLMEHHKELYDKYYPEILAFKERQFRKLEDQYDTLYQEWLEVDSESRRVHAIHKEALKRMSFADQVFQNPLLRAIFFLFRRAPNSTIDSDVDTEYPMPSKTAPDADARISAIGDRRRVVPR